MEEGEPRRRAEWEERSPGAVLGVKRGCPHRLRLAFSASCEFFPPLLSHESHKSVVPTFPRPLFPWRHLQG